MNMYNEFDECLYIGDNEFLSKNIKIDHDKGNLSIHIVRMFEKFYNMKLPRLYVHFITQHNGARIENNCFKYNNSSSNINFDEFGNIISLLESIKHAKEHNYDSYPDWHIPFGDDGGEGVLFFSYDNDHNTEDPKVVIIVEGEESPVADSFEQFISKLYVDKEQLFDQLNQIEIETNTTLPEAYKRFCIKYCTENFNKKFIYKYYNVEFIFPNKILWEVSTWNKKRLKGLIPFCIDEENIFYFRYENSKDKDLQIILHKDGFNLTEVISNNFEEFINMLYEPED